jgi:hypothetical protein
MQRRPMSLQISIRLKFTVDQYETILATLRFHLDVAPSGLRRWVDLC